MFDPIITRFLSSHFRALCEQEPRWAEYNPLEASGPRRQRYNAPGSAQALHLELELPGWPAPKDWRS